ncbi:type 1 glutamine amidotransferase domain-containing protein [Flocculibacter collagenilyticus]|uniref:type 1 glutamine amidotransferase domain-containing protein n=1 Tax=Flocculibacter collagenilyticus TaxID=2744479 RepID=UPI0018F37028|nr:type 1 glutamine amidotransferase domain-containing protein [Flocculibacter collagenilyticus]
MKLKSLLTALTLVASPLVMADNILVVMSDKAEMTLKGGKTYATGFYFNELMEPVKRFIDEGHTVTFATPSGVAPAMDPNSDSLSLFNNDQAYYNLHKSLLKELKITDPVNSPVISFNRVEQIGVDKYDAFFAPGGHAPMEDLVVDDQLGRILTAFNKASKPTGLVCHGPIALLASMPNNDEFVAQLKQGKNAKPAKNWIYSGYNMTVFSNSEEVTATKYYLNGGEMYYFPQDALISAGGKYQRSAEDWGAKVVVDRELITGQNPASAIGVAEVILKQLDAK